MRSVLIGLGLALVAGGLTWLDPSVTVEPRIAFAGAVAAVAFLATTLRIPFWLVLAVSLVTIAFHGPLHVAVGICAANLGLALIAGVLYRTTFVARTRATQGSRPEMA